MRRTDANGYDDDMLSRIQQDNEELYGPEVYDSDNPLYDPLYDSDNNNLSE